MFSSESDPHMSFDISSQGLPGLSGGEDKEKGESSGGPFQGSRFSMEELKRMQEVYMTEAKRLQEEVNDLEDDLERENMAALTIPSSTLDLVGDILKMKNEGQDMLGMHDMQSSVSGVQLTDATTHVTSNNPQRIIRSQRLEGNCSGLKFVATFQVEETVVKQTAVEQAIAAEEETSSEMKKAVIQKLDLEVDPCCLGEMMTFLSEAEKECDLQPFLRGYAEYSRWYQHRVKIFSHFKKEYPEVVSLPDGPGGTALQIMCPQQRGIIYNITWNISVERMGKCTPEISLSISSVKEVSKLDTKKTLNRAPEEFKKMVDMLGVEKALDSFLKAVDLK
ncbi:centromere protein P-like isoform X2 [Lytechinus pictus]|nr:centromere protein P-like [Lytechinus pictus]